MEDPFDRQDARDLALLDRMAHDLRSPLQGILALCELLQGGMYGPLAETQASALGDLEGQALVMQDLMEEVLDLVRIAAGRYKAEPSEFSLEEVLARLCERHGAARGEAAGRTAAPLRQDAAKVERLFDRLIRHAARTGAVEITVSAGAKSGCTVRIAPAGEVSFDPLEAPHPLGPPLARALARLLGGDVRIEGGAFVVELPRL